MNRLFMRCATLLACSLVVACSATPEQKTQNLAVEKENISPDFSVWMGEKEALLRESIKGSPFTLHQQDKAWVVTAPAQLSFNPDRPDLLLPAVLGPIARIAKSLAVDASTSVLILGHTADSKDDKENHKLSTGRARSVASIFRLSGLTRERMTHLGMGGAYILADAKTPAQNHRVEIIIMPSAKAQSMVAVYRPAHTRQLALTQVK